MTDIGNHQGRSYKLATMKCCTTWEVDDAPDHRGHDLHPGYGEGDGQLGPGGHQGGPGRGFTRHSRNVSELGFVSASPPLLAIY